MNVCRHFLSPVMTNAGPNTNKVAVDAIAHEAPWRWIPSPKTVNNVSNDSTKPMRNVKIDTKVRKPSPYVWLTDSYRAIARSLEDECRV